MQLTEDEAALVENYRRKNAEATAFNEALDRTNQRWVAMLYAEFGIKDTNDSSTAELFSQRDIVLAIEKICTASNQLDRRPLVR
jgi:hypothetical protein